MQFCRTERKFLFFIDRNSLLKSKNGLHNPDFLVKFER